MTSTGDNGPQDAPQSKNAAKASRREQMRAEMLRRQQQERRAARLKMIGSIVAVVIVVAVIIVVVVVTRGGGSDKTAKAADPAAADVTSAITKVPSSVIDAVGNGTGASIVKPVALSGAAALTADGKPRVLYIGAEFCPYCAAQRWAVVNALSRFGSFSGLGQTTSSSTDVYPNTATLSFHGATYTSDYLSFTGVEETDRDKQPLDTPSAADQKILETYDTKKYLGADGGIPFIDYGGKYVGSTMYDPQVLQGLSHAQIAKDLSNPDSDVTKSIIGSANVITGVLCQLTDQKPADVCSAPGVKAAS